MSACLFTLSKKWFENATQEYIETAMKEWLQVIKEYEEDPKSHEDRFKMDRYFGYRDNYRNASFVLLGMKKHIKVTIPEGMTEEEFIAAVKALMDKFHDESRTP